MLLFYWASGIGLGGFWLWRFIDTVFGLPKVDDISRLDWEVADGDDLPSLTVIVPARNEEEGIETCLRSLLTSDYPSHQIVAVDDRSTDKTGEIMDRVAASQSSKKQLTVIHIKELPPQWLGKTHAMWKAAKHTQSDWILFTDGDIQYRPDALRRAVGYAQRAEADHLVLYPSMVTKSAGERMMIGFFQNTMTVGLRLWKVADPDARDYVGAGAFNLLRRSAYEKVGTYEALRLEILDDLGLGKKIKASRLRQRVVFGYGLISVHWAKGALGVVHNLTKNFFALMRYRWPLSVAAAFSVAIITLGPIFGMALAPGQAKIGFGVAIVANAAIYMMMSRKTKISPFYFLTFPLAAVLTVYAMLRSMGVTLWNDGVTWRGTTYSLQELKKNAE